MKVKSIKKVKPRRVYAISTSTGTFIADGLVHHNCRRCNEFLSGNWVEYERRMKHKYGIGMVVWLKSRQKLKQGERWTIQRYKEELKKYEIT